MDVENLEELGVKCYYLHLLIVYQCLFKNYFLIFI